MTLAALAVGASLCGCGFTPMYARPGVSSGLSSIEVAIPNGRVAYLLREDLDDDLGRDRDAAPVWRLDLHIEQSRDPRGLTINDVAERYELGLKVNYSLVELATGRIAHTGEVTTQVSYDSADQPYAGIAARQDSQQRAASDAARRIQLELGVWMAHQK
ncbi:MAG TPA: LPS assembly lipoprotein LptE [Caulobacteraceae bacterium]